MVLCTKYVVTEYGITLHMLVDLCYVLCLLFAFPRERKGIPLTTALMQDFTGVWGGAEKRGVWCTEYVSTNWQV